MTYGKASDKMRAEVEEYDRPKAARSGAGVFGALIQNTQNITGVATPTAGSLAPAATRPGYQLSRYSAPTQAPTVQAWRPQSRASSSRAGSRPTSMHSSTAASIDGSQPSPQTSTTVGDGSNMKKVHSSDDMLSMKKRNKSALKLDNLHKMPLQAVRAGADVLKTGGHAVRNAEKWVMSGGKTPLISPGNEKRGDSYFGRPLTEEERRRKEYEQEKKRRRKAKEARKKQEIFVS